MAKERGFSLDPMESVVANGERVCAGHLGAVRCAGFRRRVRLAGWGLASYSVGLT